MKRFMFSLTGLLISLVVSAQVVVVPQKHRITLNVEGLKDDTCYLVNYFGDKQYVQDTAVSKGSKVKFSNPRGVPAGMYMLVQNRQRLLELIVVDQETEFSMTTNLKDVANQMKVTGSVENQTFYEYLSFLDRKRKEAEQVRTNLLTMSKELSRLDSISKKKNKKSSADSTQFKKELETFSKIDESVKKYIEDFIKQNEGFFVGRFVKSTQDIVVPPSPKASNGRPDSTFAYRYYKQHYWDNYNLNDERLVYGPLFHSKLKNYIENMIVPMPDSCKKDINALITRVEPNKEVFKYVVHVATQYYEVSSMMGMDAVFVDLVEKYYNTKKAYWIDSVTLIKYKERAKQLSYTLIGKKVPNVIMQDTSIYKSYSLHDLKAKYTLVYIWDPNCGHCQQETPKLVELYNKNKVRYGLEVYAIGTGFSEMKPWTDFIKKNKMNWINVADLYNKTNYHYLFDVYSTPVIYLLDENKNIIAKRIPLEQIIGFMDFWNKTHQSSDK